MVGEHDSFTGVLLIFDAKSLTILSLTCLFRQNLCDLYETVSIQSSVVLLSQSERSTLPVRHLLTFAQLDLVDVLGHFRQAALTCHCTHFSEIGLDVEEVRDAAIEIHLREVTRENFQVTFEAETKAERVRIGEYLSEYAV